MKCRIYARKRSALRFLQTVEVPAITPLFAFLPLLAARLQPGEKFRVRIVGY